MDGAALQIPEDLSAGPIGVDAPAGAVCRLSAQDGTEARLRQAFERCGDDLYRFIMLRVQGDRHAADDLLQQTCYEAARNKRTPSGDDAAQAWLFGIAKNLIRKHFRSLRRHGRFQREEAVVRARPILLEVETGEADAVTHMDSAQNLLTAVAALDETDQQIILGSYFEGRSHEELARAIGLSVRAIEGRLYRARQILRESLSAQLGEVES